MRNVTPKDHKAGRESKNPSEGRERDRFRDGANVFVLTFEGQDCTLRECDPSCVLNDNVLKERHGEQEEKKSREK